jgi:uncharacterized protein YggT (Ycf19 family)
MPLDNLILVGLTYIYYALRAYFYVLIASVLLSWLPEIRRTRVGEFIDRLADPYMRLFRGLIVVGMFDFTPILGFFLYQFGLNQFGRMIQIMAMNG